MRKTFKSDLGNLLKSYGTPLAELPDDTTYVLDGGHLLHTVIWSIPNTYNGLYDAYLAYVLRHYGKNAIVVFDGYSQTTVYKNIRSETKSFEINF